MIKQNFIIWGYKSDYDKRDSAQQYQKSYKFWLLLYAIS